MKTIFQQIFILFTFTLIFINVSHPLLGMEKSEFISSEGIAPGPQGLKNTAVDPMFDEKVDYSLFSGRITDRDKNGHIYKIKADTKNVKYLRAGDSVMLWINEQKKVGAEDKCRGFVHGQEQDYFVIYVEHIHHCNQGTAFLRLGTQLNFHSSVLYQRVLQASQYRNVLLESKKDFLKQLNEINHFVWSFDEEQMKMTSQFDLKIVAIKKEKQKSIDNLLNKKKEKIFLQKELIEKLNRIDVSLKYYRLDQQDDLSNRWREDHDLGLPMLKRPVVPKH